MAEGARDAQKARGARAVFLDRDGVLNRIVPRGAVVGSPRSLGEFILLDGVTRAAERLVGAGFLLFVVTNQPDIARGLLDPAELEAMSAVLRAELPLAEVRVCPHDDRDGCGCRKPRPGMLEELASRWGVVLSSSYIIGDSWRDMDAGRAAGCGRVLVRWPHNVGVESDHAVDSLAEAAEYILGEGKRDG